MIRLFRTLAGWLFSALVLSLIVLISALTLRQFYRQLAAPIARFWGRTTLKIVGVRLHILNESTMKDSEARLCILNHQSMLDVMWVGAIAPRGFTGIGKKELRAIFPINVAWWALKLHYVDRGNPEKAIRSLQTVQQQIVDEQRTLVIAPEGTRSPSGEIGPFKSGPFHIATETHIPIHPVVVAGAFELMPKSAWASRPGDIYVQYLPPIDTTSWTTETLHHNRDRTREIIDQAYQELRLKVQAG
jgi:putative phosphoserine phosphatase/1-acylglycerol-3-phosphate O-acyltransferase